MIKGKEARSLFTLADLVAPLNVSEFLTTRWPERAAWRVASPTTAALFGGLPDLESAERVLSSAASAGVFVGNGDVQMVPGEVAAARHYPEGRTCFVRSDHIRALAGFTDQIAEDLGLPRGAMHSEIFCSKGDSGAPMHSDYDVNFALLIRGHKSWRLAPNENIRNQVGQCFPAPYEKADSLGTQLADRLPFPDKMPESAVEIEVEPGGMVFVPRGWWHETVSNGECLQVNFVVKRSMWLTVLIRAIRNVLLKEADWRSYALDLFATDGREAQARDTFARLIPDLRKALDLLLAGDATQSVDRIVALSGLEPARATRTGEIPNDVDVVRELEG